MTVINTGSWSQATAFSNQRKIDRTSNNVLWATRTFDGVAGLSGVCGISYSTDEGATWMDRTMPPNGSGLSSNAYARSHSFFIDADDYAHLVFKDNGDGYIYYKRGTPNAARTDWTWGSAYLVDNFTPDNVPDIVVHREASGWVAHIVWSYTASGNTYTVYRQIVIGASGTLSTFNIGGTWGTMTPKAVVLGGMYTGAVHTYPSIDFNHTGDGKTVKDSTPHLYVAWSAGSAGISGRGIRFKKATYSGGSWPWGPEREIDSGVFMAPPTSGWWMTCLFDGTDVLIGGCLVNNPQTVASLVLYARDAADTTTTVKARTDNLASSTFRFSGCMASVAPGDVYFFGTDNEGAWDLGYYRINGSVTTFDTPVLLGTNTGLAYVSAKRAHSGNKIDFIYMSGGISVNYATVDATPLAPPSNTFTRIGGVFTRFPMSIKMAGSWKALPPILKFPYIPIGAAVYGGYFAGIIDTTKGNIIAADYSQAGRRYMLILGPASLRRTMMQWKTSDTAAPSGTRTRWDGLTATQAMVGDAATYPAAEYCAGLGYPSDGGSPWYLGAMDENELFYRNFKPTTEANSTTPIATAAGTFPYDSASDIHGVNPSSDPIGPAYTSGNPAQTSIAIFLSGGSEANDPMNTMTQWTSTEYDTTHAWCQYQNSSPSGVQSFPAKSGTGTDVRPVRRVYLDL